MRAVLATLTIFSVVALFSSSCGSSGPATFCDTTCMKDSVKFTNDDHPLKPYVFISARNCKPDTVAWSYIGMGVNRKMELSELVGADVFINKDFIRGIVTDTSYAWVLFNDCDGGRGFYVKIPFSKTKPIGRSNRAINNIDPKFDVADDLVSYIDRGNIFVEDMKTGKKAMMTFGRDISPDFASIHNSIDSVNITPTRIWARYKVDNEWQELEKKIELK